jgi:hypothetical protein
VELHWDDARRTVQRDVRDPRRDRRLQELLGDRMVEQS